MATSWFALSGLGPGLAFPAQADGLGWDRPPLRDWTRKCRNSARAGWLRGLVAIISPCDISHSDLLAARIVLLPDGERIAGEAFKGGPNDRHQQQDGEGFGGSDAGR